MLQPMVRFLASFFFLTLFTFSIFGSTWQLDSDKIQSATQSEAEAMLSSASSLQELDRALWFQAAGHLALEASQPHAGRKYFLVVEDLCDSWDQKKFLPFGEKERGRAYAVCALVEAELSIHPFPLFSYFRLQKVDRYAQGFLAEEVPEVEKHYAVARLRSALPPIGGLDFRSSLLSFRVLERLSPQTKGVHYWLAQAFRRQGQSKLSLESLERAVSEGDPRAVLVSPGIDRRWGSDYSYGFSVYPFTSPAKQQGLGVRYWDDRLQDSPLSLFVSSEASLRGNLNGLLQLGYQRSRWALTASFEGGRVVRDFFGSSQTGGLTVLGFPTSQVSGRVAFAHAVGVQKTVSVGPVFQAIDVGSFTGASFSSFFGGFATFEWDNRDRIVLTRDGVRLGLKVKALGSAVGEALIFETAFSSYRTLRLRHTFSFQASARSAAGKLPVNAFSDLYAMEVPLAREFRFQEAQAASAFLSYRWLAAPWAHLGTFLVVGSVGDRWEQVVRSPAFGAGVGFDFQFERIPRFSPRWEFGNFGGEWIFQTVTRLNF